MNKIVYKTCRNCGNKFPKLSKVTTRGRTPAGIMSKNSVNCSKRCSWEYSRGKTNRKNYKSRRIR